MWAINLKETGQLEIERQENEQQKVKNVKIIIHKNLKFEQQNIKTEQ